MNLRTKTLWFISLLLGSLIALLLYSGKDAKEDAMILIALMIPIVIAFVVSLVGLLITYLTKSSKKQAYQTDPKIERWKKIIYLSLAIGIPIIVLITYFSI